MWAIDQLLHYYDLVFANIFIFLTEMAESFSFDLRRIKKKGLFLAVMRDVNPGS
jgi:hypothetical protein